MPAISLDELHNDSTTVSFYGAYDAAGQESEQRGRPTHAITWGHSKARRPDLKGELLYILTVTSDGSVPVYFSSDSGNTVGTTGPYIGTWDLLRELIGRTDFLYVADCKLASMTILSHIATRGGRFVTVLPRGRTEDVAFCLRLRTAPAALRWTLLYALADDHGHIVAELFACGDDHVHSEGYRLLWDRSSRKAVQDESPRSRSIQRGAEALGDLQETPSAVRRTRSRERSKAGSPGGDGGLGGGGRGELLAAGRDRATRGRDVPPGDTGPAERANQVPEGDPTAVHTRHGS